MKFHPTSSDPEDHYKPSMLSVTKELNTEQPSARDRARVAFGGGTDPSSLRAATIAAPNTKSAREAQPPMDPDMILALPIGLGVTPYT